MGREITKHLATRAISENHLHSSALDQHTYLNHCDQLLVLPCFLAFTNVLPRFLCSVFLMSESSIQILYHVKVVHTDCIKSHVICPKSITVVLQCFKLMPIAFWWQKFISLTKINTRDYLLKVQNKTLCLTPMFVPLHSNQNILHWVKSSNLLGVVVCPVA